MPRNRLFAVAALLAACAPAWAQFAEMPGRWATAMPLPFPINEIAGAVLNGRFHVAGGGTEGRSVSAFHGQYDPATNNWLWRAPLPIELSHVGVAAMNRFLLRGTI